MQLTTLLNMQVDQVSIEVLMHTGKKCITWSDLWLFVLMEFSTFPYWIIHEIMLKLHKDMPYCWSHFLCRLCDNPLQESGVLTLMEALPENKTLIHLSLMHTGLGDQGALELAQRLQHHPLQELNVAYNNIGDNAALALVDACREHPSIHTVQ